jgi:hypothetical protein
MAFELKKLEGEPIVIATYKEPYDPKEDVVGTNRMVAEVLEEFEGDIYFINDIRQVKLTFPRVVQTMAAAFRDSTTLAPDRVHGIAVGAGNMLKLFVDSAKQIQYGKIDIELFDTTEEAIAFIRSKIAADE